MNRRSFLALAPTVALAPPLPEALPAASWCGIQLSPGVHFLGVGAGTAALSSEWRKLVERLEAVPPRVYCLPADFEVRFVPPREGIG